MNQLPVKVIVHPGDISQTVVKHVRNEATDKLLDSTGTNSSELLPNDYTAITRNCADHSQPFEHVNVVCKLDDTLIVTLEASAAHNLPKRPIIDRQSVSPALACYASAPTYRCNTQQNVTVNPAALQLGFNGRISRYSFGATIRYYFELDTFQPPADGEYAAKCFELAIRAWRPMPVQFKRVFARKEAFFTIVGSPKNDGSNFARAFFPSDPPDKRRVKVYSLAFSPEYRMALVNVFCHELGHVLGLRHEFAALKESNEPSVSWGKANNESVMAYHDHPMGMAVHKLDIELVGAFYAYNGDTLEGFIIDVVEPTPELAER